jgi:ATP-dependent Clp protease ATP-binding subunit ClpA
MTDQARSLYCLAEKHARAFGFEVATASHLLIATKSFPMSVASHVLRDIGLDVQVLCSTIESVYEEADFHTRKEENAAEIIDESLATANRLGYSYICTDHLILASLQVGGPIVEAAFSRLGLSMTAVVARAEKWVREMQVRRAAVEAKQIGGTTAKEWMQEKMARGPDSRQ